MNPKNKYMALLEEQNAYYCNEWRKECLNSLVREACLALASIGVAMSYALLYSAPSRMRRYSGLFRY